MYPIIPCKTAHTCNIDFLLQQYLMGDLKCVTPILSRIGSMQNPFLHVREKSFFGRTGHWGLVYYWFISLALQEVYKGCLLPCQSQHLPDNKNAPYLLTGYQVKSVAMLVNAAQIICLNQSVSISRT